MKQFLFLLCMIAVPASAQHAHPASFAPIAALTSYQLDGSVIVGPSVGLRFQSAEINSMRIGFFGGVTFRPTGYDEYSTQPFISTNDQRFPFGMRTPINSTVVRRTRYDVALGFVGIDWMVYLADGDVRPYVGVGVQSVSWLYNRTLTGTLMPEARAGLDVRLTNGFAAFGEVRHAAGFPTLYGNTLSRIDGITSVAFGVSFAPRW